MTYDTILFCSLAGLNLKVGHIMDVLSPFIPVCCHSYTESPVHVLMLWPYVAYIPRLRAPGIVPCIISFDLQATPLFPHGETIVC